MAASATVVGVASTTAAAGASTTGLASATTAAVAAAAASAARCVARRSVSAVLAADSSASLRAVAASPCAAACAAAASSARFSAAARRSCKAFSSESFNWIRRSDFPLSPSSSLTRSRSSRDSLWLLFKASLVRASSAVVAALAVPLALPGRSAPLMPPDAGGTNSRREDELDVPVPMPDDCEDGVDASATMVGRVDSIHERFWFNTSAAACAARVASISSAPGIRRIAPRFKVLTLSW